MNEAEINAVPRPFHNASLVINIIASGYRFDHLAGSRHPARADILGTSEIGAPSLQDWKMCSVHIRGENRDCYGASRDASLILGGESVPGREIKVFDTLARWQRGRSF